MNFANQETRGFQSEVKQLLHLMIHSIYSNKEIFLRELISNASDAADKLRFKALSQPDLYENNADLKVQISIDKENRLLKISDNGIGMTRNEVIENLGTIAKSGTKAFLESMNSNEIKDSQLIGQFGVGFYSSFIVADKVSVKTRKAGESPENGVFWESDGTGEYSIATIEKQTRGTEITLHLKTDEDEFLNDWNLRTLVEKYSNHITLPVEIEKINEETKEKSWEKINAAQALWIKNKNEISNEEYNEFYKNTFSDFSDPLIWAHNRVEGKHEYTSLLFVPSQAPWDLWNRDHQSGLKLFIQRVFIMDNAQQFLPQYLRFMRGIIDSNDLPLNISREILQDNKITQAIKNNLAKRSLQLLEKLANSNEEKFAQFWSQFGLVLKEGIGEDQNNKEQIAKLLRFASSHNKSSAQTVSLDDYLSRMKPEQDKIYFITADNYEAAENSPHMEFFNKQNLEVLLLSDRIDEWMMSYLTEFSGKSFQSITKSDESIQKLTKVDEEKQKETEKTFENFIEKTKNILGNRVKNISLTYRLADSPAVVTTDDSQISTQMAKLFAATGQKVPEIQYNFELNPDHHLVNLAKEKTENDAEFTNWIEFLFEQALLIEQGSLENPANFVKRINKILG